MPGATTRFIIPYPLSSDTVASLPTTDQNASQRTDLMLGESGQFTQTGAANTQVNVTLTFSRTYPGSNVVGSNLGILWLMPYSAQIVTPINWWVGSWTGSGTTLTGCIVSLISSAAWSAKTFNWRFLPSP